MDAPAELTESPTFVGDGNYVGDGGELLQRLWNFAPWKMIRNCPGRYIVKHRKRSPLLIGGVPVTTIDTGDFVRLALASEDASSAPPIVVHALQSPSCLDPVKVVVFGDNGSGGGVITYYKCEKPEVGQEGGEGDDARKEATVYVHTLNTASGLRRKLGGLQLAHVLEL